jgi:hypothetical protein
MFQNVLHTIFHDRVKKRVKFASVNFVFMRQKTAVQSDIDLKYTFTNAKIKLILFLFSYDIY